MRRQLTALAALAALAGCAAFASCGGGADEAPPVTVRSAATTPAGDGSTVPHGDHNPHHGGIVLMNGDLHFEVVLSRAGSHHVYFSDATRNDLPAATASGVMITVTQKGEPAEPVALRIDDSGESWMGQGHAVADPTASARIAYTAFGKSYFIDVPFPR